jgi:CRISPR system Cascade subunit CasA
MTEFNLIDQDWIPCIDLRGDHVEYGIHNTLLKGHELREICDDSPLVTVAIHRLLLAILYRVYSGPRQFAEWKGLYARRAFDPSKVTRYLDNWKGKDRFRLLGDTHPFFQMAKLETKRKISVNRLATECASGNNATLFDHSGDEQEVEWPPRQAARQLIACQSFALGFGKSGDAKIDGREEVLPYSADAAALRGMSIWLQGGNLFDTLMINLAPTDDRSLPSWELQDSNGYRDRLDGKARKNVTSFGVIDRLTWQSRLVRLIPNSGTVSRMFFTQGRSADKSAGDPMKVYRTSKEGGVSVVPLSSGKAAWREAHSILMIPPPASDERRPECFNLLARARAAGEIKPDQRFVAHIVGMASAPNKAGKFLLWRHERMPVRTALLADTNLIERLGGLLGCAEQAAKALDDRARRIAKLYLSPGSGLPNGRQPDKDEVTRITRIVEAIDPRPAYWTRMGEYFAILLEDLPNDWSEAASDWKPGDQQTATRNWRAGVKHEARRALEESIRSLGTTARAIQAVARIGTDFRDEDLDIRLQKTPMTTGSPKANGKGGKKR